ncbi:MAG: MoaD/ThiS family protein [Desulfurococcaceae archaeon]
MRTKYMLWLAAKARVEEEIVDIEPGSTILDLLLRVRENNKGLAKYIDEILSGRSEIIVLHNSSQPAFGLRTTLRDGDTIVLIPPVSGG